MVLIYDISWAHLLTNEALCCLGYVFGLSHLSPLLCLNFLNYFLIEFLKSTEITGVMLASVFIRFLQMSTTDDSIIFEYRHKRVPQRVSVSCFFCPTEPLFIDIWLYQKWFQRLMQHSHSSFKKLGQLIYVDRLEKINWLAYVLFI